MARAISIYLTDDIVIQIDAAADAQRAALPGRVVSRNAVVREILARHFAAAGPVSQPPQKET